MSSVQGSVSSVQGAGFTSRKGPIEGRIAATHRTAATCAVIWFIRVSPMCCECL
jgi:hypothetical protein